MEYICHSGGCPGADMTWEVVGEEFGVHTISYSFPGHTQYGIDPFILSAEELNEGFEHVKIASLSLGRKISEYWPPPYVKSLLSRNWFQVKNSARIFAIGTFETRKHKKVKGGTGWAVQMGIDQGKPVFFFDQDACSWFDYHYGSDMFKEIPYIPLLTTHFAGIGTREISDEGTSAIIEVYDLNFNNYRER